MIINGESAPPSKLTEKKVTRKFFELEHEKFVKLTAPFDTLKRKIQNIFEISKLHKLSLSKLHFFGFFHFLAIFAKITDFQLEL